MKNGKVIGMWAFVFQKKANFESFLEANSSSINLL